MQSQYWVHPNPVQSMCLHLPPESDVCTDPGNVGRGKDLPHQEGMHAVCQSCWRWQQQGCASGREGSNFPGEQEAPCSPRSTPTLGCSPTAHAQLDTPSCRGHFPTDPGDWETLVCRWTWILPEHLNPMGLPGSFFTKCFEDFKGSPDFTQTFVSWSTQIQPQMRYCSPLWLCHKREGGERKKQKAPKDDNC